ncbi:MAG: hypothetical protein ACRDPC_00340 [Solirubrobacteraceae bacterium]
MTASSGGGPAGVSDGLRQRGYRFHWQDGSVRPIGCRLWVDGKERRRSEWVQVEWRQPRTFDEVVLRMPVLILMPEPRRTIGRLVLQYWDGGWWNVRTTNGQPNPVLGWVAPAVADGTETRAFAFEPITSALLRVVVEDGNREGWCFLDAIEVYERRPATPPFRLRAGAAIDADVVIQPGDRRGLDLVVSDAAGLAVRDVPVTLAPLDGGGEVAGGDDVRTDRGGRAAAILGTGAVAGLNRYAARAGGDSVAVELRTLPREAALEAGLRWLERTAAEHQRGSRVTAFDGTVMYTPDGASSYDGFWVRDFQYMIEGHPAGVPEEHIRRGFEYLIARQRDDGAMPNKVLKDGTPVYCPGTGCESVFGPLPPPDNPSFMVKIAYHHWRLTGDSSLFGRYREQLVRGMAFLPRSPSTRLVHIPPEAPSSPYGFSDAIAKTGDQLFDSLLYREAAGNLAELFGQLGDPAQARRWAAEATDIERDLQTLHDHASGMFLAASEDCRQIDVWGSAYAAHSGAIPDAQQLAVARYLRDNYDGIVCRGQVRHTAPGEHWRRTLVPNDDVYQNGAYWALPSGWVASVIALVDRGLAAQMLLDLVKDFQQNGVNEAINPAVGYAAIPRYVASATNAIPALTALVRG